jgi:hypothetical protein
MERIDCRFRVAEARPDAVVVGVEARAIRPPLGGDRTGNSAPARRSAACIVRMME